MSVDREWTEDEADELQNLLSRGLSWDLVGTLLHRGQEAVRTQAAIMGISRPGVRPYTPCDRRGGEWSVTDLGRLGALVSGGRTWREIARQLGRTRYACKLKAARLGLLRGEDADPCEAGWPELIGTPAERDERFRCTVIRAAYAAGLVRQVAA